MIKDIKDSLLEFVSMITDAKTTIYSKILKVVLIVILLFFINDITGFSFYFKDKARLWQIQQINEILKDTTLSKVTRQDMLKLREETFNHKSFVASVLEKITWNNLTTRTNANTQQIKNMTKNDWWMLLSTSWLFIILMIAYPFQEIKINKPIKQKLLGVLSVELTLLFFSFLLTTLCYLIPVIDNDVTYNYAINFFITFLPFATYMQYRDLKKKNP